MRVMGLDVGSKTVGVAISDPLGFTAQGVEIIKYREPRPAAMITKETAILLLLYFSCLFDIWPGGTAAVLYFPLPYLIF